MLQVANADRLAFLAASAALRPAPAIDLEAWAIENVVFSAAESEFAGPYNPALFPYFTEILAALSPSDPSRIVTLAKSAQIGGTVLANVFCLAALDLDAADFLYVHPTTDNAMRWSKLKLEPMMAGIQSLAEAFPKRSRDGGDAVLMKRRVDRRASLLISGANSPASLSQVSMPRQVQDDLAKWETHPTAGDPENMADTRSASREFAKVFKVSTPLVEPGCRISRNFRAGTQERFHIPCPHCGHFHPLEWDNMAATIRDDDPGSAHFTCPECGCAIEEHHRAEIVKAGRWVASNPTALGYHRSFQIWSAYSPLTSWERIAREWLAARGEPAREQVFRNDVAGLAYETLGEAPPAEKLAARAEAGHRRGVVPAGFPLLTIGMDVQGDRIEWQAVAWDRHLRRAAVETGEIAGHIAEPHTWAALDAVVRSEWRAETGGRLGVELAAIDGNAYTEDVWQWVQRHPASRVVMVRGVAGPNAPLIARVKRERTADGRLRKYSRRFFNFAADNLKLNFYRCLEKEELSERAAVLFPAGLPADYFHQLTAERRRKVIGKDGFARYQWVKDPHQANEALDTMLQAEVAAIRCNVRVADEAQWSRLEAERCVAPAEAQGDLEDMMALRPAPSATVAPRERDGTAPRATRREPRRMRTFE